MDDTITIRKAKLAEIELLQELVTKTFVEAWTAYEKPEDIISYVDKYFNNERIKEELSDESMIYFIIYSNSLPAGYVKLEGGAQPESYILEKPMALHRLYVKKEFQGRKLGSMLIEEAITTARKKGYKTLWLGVWNKNLGATRLYKQFGFEIFGHYQFIMGSSISDDYLMQLTIA